MKILWITNTLFPEASTILKGGGDLRASGGWMLASAEALINEYDVELYVATVSSLCNEIRYLEGKTIKYVVLPMGKGNTRINHQYDKCWAEVDLKVKPDIVHIHGTEFSHGLSYLQTCGTDKAVISIQGMNSAYCYYYYYGISTKDILLNTTIADICFGNLIKQKYNTKKSGEYEKEMIQSVGHIIGRTSWDRSRTWAINDNAQYYFCNETLRSEFYDGTIWRYDNCNKHSIFLSQAGTPIKGLIQLIKAFPRIKKYYPDVQIRIGGWNPCKRNTFREKLQLSGYGKILSHYIKKNGLEGHITFLGGLNADEMKQEYINCNVFVTPSSIENSPNSLGEAQLLGVPCIVSYVGGVHDMVPTPECGDLYRFEEFEMLAYKVCQMFETSKSFDNTTMRRVASERHDPKRNVKTLYDIYTKILKK